MGLPDGAWGTEVFRSCRLVHSEVQGGARRLPEWVAHIPEADRPPHRSKLTPITRRRIDICAFLQKIQQCNCPHTCGNAGSSLYLLSHFLRSCGCELRYFEDDAVVTWTGNCCDFTLAETACSIHCMVEDKSFHEPPPVELVSVVTTTLYADVSMEQDIITGAASRTQLGNHDADSQSQCTAM